MALELKQFTPAGDLSDDELIAQVEQIHKIIGAGDSSDVLIERQVELGFELIVRGL